MKVPNIAILVASSVIVASLAFSQLGCSFTSTDASAPARGSDGGASALGISGSPSPNAAGSNDANIGGNSSLGGALQSTGGPSEAGGAQSAGAGGAIPGGASGLGGRNESGGAAAVAPGCGWTKGVDDKWSMAPTGADKRILFDGTDLSRWHRLNEPGTKAQWKVLPGGMMEVVPQTTPTNIQSNAKFDDVCLHVEYWTPAYAPGVGVQMQGNSGVYLKSAYELQVLDTSMLGKLIDGCGAA